MIQMLTLTSEPWPLNSSQIILGFFSHCVLLDWFLQSLSKMQVLLYTEADEISEAMLAFTHQSQPFNVLVSGCRYNDLLPPVWAQEVLQIALKRLHASQFLRKVDGSDSRMVAVLVQLMLQLFVDLVEGAQQNLVEIKLLLKFRTKGCLSPFQLSISLCDESYLVLRQGDLPFLVTLHQLCVFSSNVDLLRCIFNLLW